MEFYFHIGFTKVASKYFQQKVFPYLTDVRFYKKHQYNKYKQVVRENIEGKYLFSSEKDKRIVQEAKEILEVCPDAKFIIFVRRHDDWLLSRYKYRIRKYGFESFPEFFNMDRNDGLWKLEELALKEKIQTIEKMASTKPLVLTHDYLRQDPEGFVRAVLAYMGTGIRKEVHRERVHTAFNEKQLIGLRKWNRWFPYFPEPFKSRVPKVLYRRFKQYVLHIVAFIILIFPKFFFRNKTLLTPADRDEMKRLRDYYSEDWAFCKEYEKQYRD